MRLKSWVKNIFIFVPLVFSAELFNLDKLLETTIAFAAFCFVSSAVYVFNDVCDAESDALHPVKRLRPVASGAISKRNAVIFATVLAAIGLLSAVFGANMLTGILAAVYFAMNLAYSLRLKRIAIIDCFCVAAGFVLRIYAGGAASGEAVSDWLFLTVVAMSLFMAFGKRRGELIKVDDSSATRDVLQRYNLAFLQGIVFLCAGLSVVFYSLWALYRGHYMLYTVPLVIFLVSKYLLLVHNSESHGDPTTVMFEDKTMLAACLLYGLTIVGLLYFAGGA